MRQSASDAVDGRLSPATLARLIKTAGERFGLDVTDATLIKFTNNAVFRLPRSSAVVRIAGSATVQRRTERVVRVAQWLAEHDFPSVRLDRRAPSQPVNVNGHRVTVWELAESNGPRPTGSDLARLLRRFHALPIPAFTLPRWDQIREIRSRLLEPEGISGEDRDFLLGRCDNLTKALSALTFTLPEGPIHGDAFMGNLIPGAAGPILCDFDSTCFGPREWDLTPMAVGKLRMSYVDDDFGPFAEMYGSDVTRWEGFSVLRDIRELQLASSVVPVLKSNPSLRGQFEHRLKSLRRGDTTVRWAPYQ